MKCETVRNMLSSYIDKDLNNIEKAELEKHLTECKECREEYESLLDIIAVCGNFEEVELPQSFRTELHQRLIEEKEKKKYKFFSGILGNNRMKMATGLVAAVLVVVIGIGSGTQLFNKSSQIALENNSSADYGRAGEYSVAPAAADENTALNNAEEAEYGIAAAEAPQEPFLAKVAPASRDSDTVQFSESAMADTAAPAQGVDSSRSGRMVIRTGNISVNVENVDKAATDIRQLTESSGGFVENSQIDNYTVPQVQEADRTVPAKEKTEKYANMTVRVPEVKFEDVFNDIKGMGKLVSENMSGSDITAEYRDTTARVDNLKVQEESLKQLMIKARTVDEILKIESELSRVRTEIEINSGNLKHWDNLVQLSTINIYMKELKPEELNSVDVPGMWEKAWQGFIKAVNNVVAGLQNIFIILVAAIPYLLVVGFIALVGVAIGRRIKKKKV